MGNPDSGRLGAVEVPLNSRATIPLAARPGSRPQNPYDGFAPSELERSITSRFDAIARRHADRVAVQSGGARITYAELSDWVDRIAQAILGRQPRPDAPVALMLNKGPAFFAAMLGALKAGSGFVPLENVYPQERFRRMLEDSGAGLVLTSPEVGAVPNGLAALNVADLPGVCASGSVFPPVSPDALAYLLYTSGSTGGPKGVSHTHRSALQNVVKYTNAFHISCQDRLTVLHSCSASAGVVEVLCGLLNGAMLCPWDLRDQGLAGMAEWIEREGVTIYSWSPTPFRQFVHTLEPLRKLRSPRLAVLGNEPVLGRDMALVREHFSESCLFVSRLGTTETNNFAIWFASATTPIPEGTVPAGYAVEGKEVLLLDEAGKEVGLNRVGEIVVRSDYLAAGYWRNPALTQSRFPLDPTGSGKRVFLTGDLGILRPDGCLECIGRKDFQLKVRGARIDPGEIEEALLQIPSVKAAVVVGAPALEGETRLVAYVIPSTPVRPTVTALRHALGKRLPDFMIPSKFVFLERLPLTPSGKLDRRGLPSVGDERPSLDAAFLAPRTPFEKVLCAMWESVLGVKPIGVHDDFTDLGGTSLTAAMIVSRLGESLRVELPVRALFESSTVATLAMTVIEERMKGMDDAERIRLLATLDPPAI
jgi:amino acid adenylation domain-containing protein